jgi:pimeloyl-ACP methyl ester carboxylesterase
MPPRFTVQSHRSSVLVAALALVTAIAVSACNESNKLNSPVQPAAAVDVTATVPARATPQQVAVTPAAIDFIPTDPAFEALAGARAIWGADSGSTYQIEVPDAWNGEVVFFAHGFRGSVPELTVTAPPIREHLIANGFAWAASSYSANGYEPGVAAADTLALRDVVAREIGPPFRSYLYGQSMGGHVTAIIMEQHPTAFDGAFAECGAIGGSEILDYFMSWGLVSGHVTGIDLSPISNNPELLASSLEDVVMPALGDVRDPSASGEAFASIIQHLTGGERPFFREGYDMSFGMNFTILRDAVGSPGAANAAAQNTHVTYQIDPGLGFTPDDLNRTMPRVEANAGARDRELRPEFADNTGRIERPVLTIHDTGDLFVPISLEQTYRRRVEAAGRGDLLVQRAIRRPGHCNFSPEERMRAFDDLILWVRGGVKPEGDDLLGDLSDVGRAYTEPLEEGDPGGLGARLREAVTVEP